MSTGRASRVTEFVAQCQVMTTAEAARSNYELSRFGTSVKAPESLPSHGLPVGEAYGCPRRPPRPCSW